VERKTVNKENGEGREPVDNSSGALARVRATCLEIAEILGPELMDAITVVGGLVPSLLIPEESLPRGVHHAATLDLDFGLGLSLPAGPGIYDRISDRLETTGFSQESEGRGRSELRWRWPASGQTLVWVDFIPDAAIHGKPPWLPEIRLAMAERDNLRLEGRALRGNTLTAKVWVCRPAVFLLLKAIAFLRRRDRKDAHDLYFVLRYYEGELLRPVAELARTPEGERFLAVLEEFFSSPEAEGPLAVAHFLSGGPDDEVQQDVVGAALRILKPLFRD
jgi:hypothetical protein